MQRIIPNIWCQGTAAAAASLYDEAFPDVSWEVTGRYPTSGLPDVPRELAGQELVVDVVIGGYRMRLINAGAEYRPGPAISFLVTLGAAGSTEPDHAPLERAWAALSSGGEVRMPLGEYPFSPRYGWVEDRFGVNWQLMIADAATDAGSPAVVPQFAFTGAAPRAARAIEQYTGLFEDSGLVMLMSRPAAAGEDAGGAESEDATRAERVQFAAFRLAGQQFSAMDAGPVHAFDFTPGVSLQVDCADQAEIDRLWAALSAVPEAEQCGWLVDRFGVSWQIVPTNMGELLRRPGAHQHLMAMKKLVIDEF